MNVPSPGHSRRIALIHTVPGLIATLDALLATEMPDWTQFNILDESLLKNTIREGVLSHDTKRRLVGYVWSAVDGGADAIVVTCSSLGAAVEAARPFCPVPLFRIDQGVAEDAVARGTRIGVLATLATTLNPTTALIDAVSARNGRTGQETVSRVCEGAFDLLAAGDVAGHDAAVAAAIAELAADVDVIVLAQASMARAIEGPSGAGITCPVLTSPKLGIRHIRDALTR
ncbi:aspartate/glutamate racemase family protein [Roseibium salinum]|uniref:Aspartate/glutamate racemase family protein n=1 Tax=Roseibium salinum TaxID=1604349 RepID=A0ABT3QW51_9HYPH|nr:aspartate/glutamate racemase family protein [Roseibium sp. DSM 29163]MCX2721154.1 aspartate/glutamate racemase family protein [Roseibium sp. DSM 29163]MDN3722624.1 aspartate/glutamate racemase family protein [Roseibium salinum]